jgi:hypothetical protein
LAAYYVIFTLLLLVRPRYYVGDREMRIARVDLRKVWVPGLILILSWFC